MMTIEQATALYLDIHNPPTGDLRADLIASGKIAQRWRTVGPEATATICHALHRHLNMSHREIAAETHIPRESVRRLIERLEAGEWGSLPEAPRS